MHVCLMVEFIQIFMLFIIFTIITRQIRNPIICINENKGTDQLCNNCTAYQRLYFRSLDSTKPLFAKSKITKVLTIFCGCIAWFVSHMVGNPNC